MNQPKTETRKKSYEKPEARRFPLRPEEAVLGFCKSSTAAGPSGSSCMTVGPCKTAGS